MKVTFWIDRGDAETADLSTILTSSIDIERLDAEGIEIVQNNFDCIVRQYVDNQKRLAREAKAADHKYGRNSV